MAQILRKIGLEDIVFLAAIGLYDEERIIKNKFITNVWVEIEVAESEYSDELENTVNYVRLYDICKQAFSKERKLIEPVAHEILSDILKEFSFVNAAFVKIEKLNPPIQAEIAKSFIELNYSK